MSFRRSRNRGDKELGYQYKAKKRVVLNVYVRTIEQLQTGVVRDVNAVQVWEISSGVKGKSMHEKLQKLRTDKTSGGDFTDPLNGFDLVLTRTGDDKENTV